jgi:hypothetical protein
VDLIEDVIIAESDSTLGTVGEWREAMAAKKFVEEPAGMIVPSMSMVGVGTGARASRMEKRYEDLSGTVLATGNQKESLR